MSIRSAVSAGAFRIPLVASMLLAAFTFAPARADAQSDDKAYCAELVDLYGRYIQNSPGHRFDVEALAAIDQCRSGNVEAGIPVLERKLRQGQISLPGNFRP
ncbi:hypothetical protein [Reyranella sp.]|jgi:hypothetical protein|uniref:hypothetical protein n=1 Tax=Reyranella sp. TaxID=1929291 RepID=UPI002F92443B